jgi:WD40 repeat protein
VSAAASDSCPYRGLVPYYEEDADYFFGRQSDTGIIVANCLTTRVTLLYGASGVGKSSVLYAGVMRELRERAERNLAERECPECAGVAFRSWRDDPVEGLRLRVKEVLKNLLPGSWTAKLPAGTGTLRDAFRVWTEFMQSDLVLLLDQFEEYFLYRDVHDTRFIDEIVAAVNDPDLRVNVLISLREDALAQLDTFKARIPGLFDNCLRIEHLTEASARQAIEEPLKLHNSRLANGARRIAIGPGLVDAVIDQVRAGRVQFRGGSGTLQPPGMSGSGRVEAPYLQMVMMRLWREEMAAGSDTLRLSTLHRLGGAEEIVRTHLDRVMASSPKKEQVLASRVFHQLVTPGGTKIAHYVDDLAKYVSAPPAAIGLLFDHLDDPEARVLRDVTPPGAPSKRYEIFHDLLAAPILDWRQRFVAHQHRWRSRLKWGALMLLVAVLSGIGISRALRDRSAADLARFEAEKGRTKAEVAQQLAESQSLASEQQKLEIDHFRRIEEQKRRNADARLSELYFNETIQQLQTPEAVKVMQSTAQLAVDGPAPTPRPKVRPPTERSALPPAAVVEGAATFATDKIFLGHIGDVWTARYSASVGPKRQRFVVTAGKDATARIWDLMGDGDCVLDGHRDEVNVAAFNPHPAAHPESWLVATGSDDRTARLWKLTPGYPFASLEGHTGPISGVVWSSDGKQLVTTSKDATIRIWNVTSAGATSRPPLTGHTKMVYAPSLVETPAGKWLVTPSTDGTARVWSFPDGRPGPVLNHGASVRRAVLDATGTWVVTAGSDGRAVLWDRASGKQLHEVFHDKAVRDVAFRPSGSVFVTSSADGTAQVWDAATRQGLALLKGHTAEVFNARFTPNGTGVVTVSWDRTARLWDYAAHRCVAVLTGHANVLWSVEFSPQATNFTTTSADGTARLWLLKQIPGGESFLPPATP